MARKTSYVLPDETFPCYFKCGRELRDKFNQEAEEWEWFTHYGAETVHFCPTCFKERRHDVELIRDALNKKPEGYPKVYATTPRL